MRQYGMSTFSFTDTDDEPLKEVLSQVISEFPRCGEEIIRQILCQKKHKGKTSLSL